MKARTVVGRGEEGPHVTPDLGGRARARIMNGMNKTAEVGVGERPGYSSRKYPDLSWCGGIAQG